MKAFPSEFAVGPTPSGALQLSPSLHWTVSESLTALAETLIVESPLAIEVVYERQGIEVRKVLGITMRTPGEDEEIALGFLHAEGLIRTWADLRSITVRADQAREPALDTCSASLRSAPSADLERIGRGFLTTSACGLCGRPSLQGLPLNHLPTKRFAALTCARLAALPELLRQHQPLFARTGGSHGAMLASASGDALFIREDVGRHNAVDKVVGAALRANLSFAEKILVLSGRASFELVQKAAAAGLQIVVAVGAPSSAAVHLAHAAGITLVGFARGERVNVYTHADQLELTTASAVPCDDDSKVVSVP